MSKNTAVLKNWQSDRVITPPVLWGQLQNELSALVHSLLLRCESTRNPIKSDTRSMLPTHFRSQLFLPTPAAVRSPVAL